jgi:hypothetical protein
VTRQSGEQLQRGFLIMSGVRVRVTVCAADADPSNSGCCVDVELPPAPAGWAREHADAVASAVEVDTQIAVVSLRFADGAQLPVLPGMPGWRMLSVMGPGDVLTVASGASAAPAGHPAAVAPRSAPAGCARPRGPFSPVEGVLLPEEQLNHKRLHMLFLSEPAEIRKALQQVRLRPPSYELSFTLSL